MDVLDRNDMKENYLVMDTALIHTPPAKGRDLVGCRRYECLYLPSYSTSSIQLKDSDKNKG